MALTFTSTGSSYTARDDTKHYAVAREALSDVTTWSLTIHALRRNGTTGPLLSFTAHDSKATCVDVATAYSELGDDYWPTRIGGPDRIAAAIASVRPAPEPPAAPGPFTADATHFERAQAERVARLRELAADRPAHATYLETLLAAAPDAILDDVPSPSGVSARVAHALIEDVDWCRMPFPADGHPSTYPAAYAARRQTDAAAARRRAAARPAPGGGTLRDMLNLG